MKCCLYRVTASGPKHGTYTVVCTSGACPSFPDDVGLALVSSWDVDRCEDCKVPAGLAEGRETFARRGGAPVADELTIPKKDNEFRLKMKIGGQDKEMVIDTGYSGEIFVDADNFTKVSGTAGRDKTIIDATGKRTTAPTKTDVDVEIPELGIKVKKTVTGLRRGGSNLVGLKFWPNIKDQGTAVIDLVNGTVVIKKKPEKVKKAKTGYFYVKAVILDADEGLVKVPFVVPDDEEGARGTTEEEPEHVPFVVPGQDDDEHAGGAHEDDEPDEVPFVVPPQDDETI